MSLQLRKHLLLVTEPKPSRDPRHNRFCSSRFLSVPGSAARESLLLFAWAALREKLLLLLSLLMVPLIPDATLREFVLLHASEA